MWSGDPVYGLPRGELADLIEAVASWRECRLALVQPDYRSLAHALPLLADMLSAEERLDRAYDAWCAAVDRDDEDCVT